MTMSKKEKKAKTAKTTGKRARTNITLHLKKRAMVAALESTMGIVSAACQKVGIARVTHYEWLKNDEEYKRLVDSINDLAVDFAESTLFKNIKDGDVASTIFFLKTRGKARGYVERQEIDAQVETKIKRFTLQVKPDDE